MILTVTLNAALDVTYETAAVTPGSTHRVRSARRRAGGKGVNVARVAAALGASVLVTGLAGGRTGGDVRADLDAADIPHSLHPVQGTTRSTLTVVTDNGEATVFNEAGPAIDPGEWSGFQAHYRSLLRDADVVVLSGSLPPGIPRDAYATLCTLAGDRPVILDADSDALSLGVSGRPTVVKPNAEELNRATGKQALPGARDLQAAGASTVLVSLGQDGLLAVTPDGVWRARPPEPLTGNPTGAGDAAVAAVALAPTAPWPDVLRHATALSAAAVLAPLAGDFDAAARTRLLPEIVVEGPPCPS